MTPPHWRDRPSVFAAHRGDCLCDGCFIARGHLIDFQDDPPDPRAVWCVRCGKYRTLSNWCYCTETTP